MAEDLNTNLFTKNGKPLVFCLRPCAEKSKIRPLVQNGGGKVISQFDPESIKLAVDGDQVTSDDFISTKYIHECVKQNKLLEIEAFKMKRGTLRKRFYDKAEELSDISDDLSPSSSVIVDSRGRKGRRKYTLEEDMAIIKYVVEEQRRGAISGTVMYKDMEMLKLTDHSADSMNCRMRKYILPNIKEYDIPDAWKAYLLFKSSPTIGTDIRKFNSGSPVKRLFQNSTKGSEKESKNEKLEQNNQSNSKNSSTDEHGKELVCIAKTAQTKNPRSVSGKRLIVDLSNSIIEKDKNDSSWKSKRKEKTDLDQENENHNIEEVSSSEDKFDTSLLRYCNVEDSKMSQDKARKRKNSPAKPGLSPENKKRSAATKSPLKKLNDEFEQEKHSKKNLHKEKNQKEIHVEYVMEDEEDTSGIMSDGDASDNEEVNRLQRVITRLGELYGLLDDEVFYLLKENGGNVGKTMKFIETG